MYCQFLSGSKTDHFIYNKDFNDFKKKIRFMIELMNTKYYGEYNNTISLLAIYERINEVVTAERREDVALKIVEDYLEVVGDTSEEKGRKYDHHRFKTLIMNSFINVFASYVLVVRYQEGGSKKRVQRIVRRYFRGLKERGEVMKEMEEEMERVVLRVAKGGEGGDSGGGSDWESYESEGEKKELVAEEKVIKIKLNE